MATQQPVNKKYFIKDQTIASFYIIQHRATGKKYAGSRYAKHCNPEELLKNDGYCTSSDDVYSIIKNDGVESFEIIQIITEFDGLSARQYEDSFLRNNGCRESDEWFNLPLNVSKKPQSAFVLKQGVVSKPLPPLEYLKECFDYDTESGILTWKVRPISHFGNNISSANKWNNRYANKQVGDNKCIDGMKYVHVTIDYVQYFAHRIIFKFQTGEDPQYMVDHINGNKADNRWCNLRSANTIQNSSNRAISPKNTSGHTGVREFKKSKTWVAHIKYEGQSHHLGTFSNFEDAVEARLAAELKYHGEYSSQHRVNVPINDIIKPSDIIEDIYSCYTGIKFSKNKRWIVRIAQHRKKIHIGAYKKLEDAIKAREEAELQYFGEVSEANRTKYLSNIANGVIYEEIPDKIDISNMIFESNCIGVTFDKRCRKWLARISYNRKDYILGHFINLEDAIQARKDAEMKYFGKYTVQKCE